MKITYEHYRVSDFFNVTRANRGKPSKLNLTRCFRKRGRTHPSVYLNRWFPRGGKTVCIIWNDRDRAIAIGEATCSMSDNFCYRIGREIALGRAKAQMAESIK